MALSRRGVRRPRIPGDVEARILRLAAERYTPGQIHEALDRWLTERSRAAQLPSTRTVERIVKDLDRAAKGDAWSFASATPDEAALVLPVLAAVIARTDGRVREFTAERGRWIAKLRLAVPSLPLWPTYLLAGLYVGAAGHPREATLTERLDTFVAFAPWRDADARDRYVKAIGGQIPLTMLVVVPELTHDGDAPFRMEERKELGPAGEVVFDLRPSTPARRVARPRATAHVLRIEAMLAKRPVPLYRAACECGWYGDWLEQKSAAEKSSTAHASAARAMKRASGRKK